VTNGQALNAYAYVYNDPINLVDPGGNIPGIRSLVGEGAQLGLRALDWYLSEPENCSSCDGDSFGLWGPVGGVLAQGANGVLTTPAEMYGSKVVETLVSRQVERSISLRWLRANGTHYTGANRRVTIETKPRTRPGPSGFAGAAAWAAWIDGITQLISDWNLCLSRMQKANRFALSLVLGLAAGTAGGLAFAAFAGATITLTPVLAGLAFGYGASVLFDRGIRQPLYEGRPDLFGG
jgi:hypothetical protein